jgi:hypothetical protein
VREEAAISSGTHQIKAPMPVFINYHFCTRYRRLRRCPLRSCHIPVKFRNLPVFTIKFKFSQTDYIQIFFSGTKNKFKFVYVP